jgi:hypothetical protein
MLPRRPLALSVLVKVSLTALCALGGFAGLDRFVDKGFGWRRAREPRA